MMGSALAEKALFTCVILAGGPQALEEVQGDSEDDPALTFLCPESCGQQEVETLIPDS